MSRIYRRLKECEIEVNGPTDAACKKAEEMIYDALGYNKGFYDQNNNVRCNHNNFIDKVHTFLLPVHNSPTFDKCKTKSLKVLAMPR